MPLNQSQPYNNNDERQDVSPYPSGFIEGFREVGYNTQTAIADIVDNSITAGASLIKVEFNWRENNSFICILDNGKGMTNEELINAMRPGNRNPWNQRNPNDLGRFGLGLKTASFSQCRKFTVVSKSQGEDTAYWTWDLDLVADSGKWEIVKHVSDPSFISMIEAVGTGTLVVWENLDRILGSGQKSLSHFLGVAEDSKRHLSITFHRFIEQGKARIYFNNREVVSWDPFLKGHTATQVFPEEFLGNGQVLVKPYILPHRSKLDHETYTIAQGPEGWDAQQGFYIYRNQRLLVSADWLGLFRKEGHYKLTRILVDLPNHLDEEWSLDVKKSRAKPPYYLINDLQRIALNARISAEAIFRHRGKVLERSLDKEFEFVWEEKLKHNKIFYSVNREHSYVKEFLESLPEYSRQFGRILKIIEETVPIRLAIAGGADKQDRIGAPLEGTPTFEIVDMMKFFYKSWIKKGQGSEQAKLRLMRMEPFSDFPQLIQTLSDE